MARSVIPWFGGKNKLAPKIASLLPADASIYCEPFGGAASVLMAKPRSPVEVYNDRNEGLYSLFTVLRDPNHYARFYSQLVLTPYGRRDFDNALERWRCSSDVVEKALAFYTLARQSFGANSKNWGYDKQPGSEGLGSKSVASLLHAQDELPLIHERLRTIIVENNDWRAVLDAYDSPTTVFYADPPYVPETRKGGDYHYEMSLDDHRDLVDRLLSLGGRAILSGYPSAVYEPLEKAGWVRFEWERHCMAAGNTKAMVRDREEYREERKRTECVWVHPAIKLDENTIIKSGAKLGEPIRA